MHARTITDVSTTIHRGGIALAAVRDRWETLVTQIGNTSPFMRPGWIEAWWQVYGTGREPFILEVRAKGRTVGLVPLQITHTRITGARLLEFLGGGAADRRQWLLNPRGYGLQYYNDIPVIPTFNQEVSAALCNWITTEQKTWDKLRLVSVPAAHPLAQSIRELITDLGGTVNDDLRRTVNCAQSWSELSGSWSKRQRRHLRYEPGALARDAGELSLVSHRGAGLQNAMETYLQLHQRRWEAESKPGLPAKERTLYRELAGQAPAGWVSYELRCGNRTVASQFGADLSGRYTPYNFAFDPAFAHRSPSNVLMQYILESFCADAHVEVDLAGMSDSMRWGTGERRRLHFEANTGNKAGQRRARYFDRLSNTLWNAQQTRSGKRLRVRLAALSAAAHHRSKQEERRDCAAP